jgi:ankyrin repeat protein
VATGAAPYNAVVTSGSNGHEAMVKLLLETGKIDVDLKDRSGQTPL